MSPGGQSYNCSSESLRTGGFERRGNEVETWVSVHQPELSGIFNPPWQQSLSELHAFRKEA